MRTSTARVATLAATLALAGSGLVLAAPAAQAAPVFTVSNIDSDGFAHDDSAGTCTESGQVESGTNNDVPVIENGPAVPASASASVTASNGGDVMTSTAAVSSAGSISSVGTNLKSIDFTTQGSINITSTLPTSSCDLHTGANTNLDFTFTVAQPGFLTVKIKKSGGVYAEFYLQMVTPANSPYSSSYGDGMTVDQTTRIYLPAGSYTGSSTGSVGDTYSEAYSGTGSGSIHAAFTVAGSTTAALSGKGKKYVTFPAARTCAAHLIATKITDKKKRASDVKQVKFFVNDALVKKVNTPDKGEAVNLSVADNVTADVTVQVKLFPARKGKPGKVYEASTSYEACSG
jgi:hypothetical protein